jgi:hypothetical protein
MIILKMQKLLDKKEKYQSLKETVKNLFQITNPNPTFVINNYKKDVYYIINKSFFNLFYIVIFV